MRRGERGEEPQRTVASERNRERWKIERGTYRESEKEGERGEVAIGEGGRRRRSTEPTRLWLCCMPPGYPASHRLHPSPFLPYLHPSLSLTSSFSHRRDPARFSAFLSLSRVLSLSPSLSFPRSPRGTRSFSLSVAAVLPLVSWFLSTRARSFNTP